MTKTLGWNGLQLTIPYACDDIVSGNRHLVIERDFQPVLEIRWENPEGKKQPASIQSVIRQIRKTSSQTCSEVTPPPELSGFTSEKEIHCLQTGESELSLIWLCSNCHTLILCRLFQHALVPLTELSGILSSITCHQADNQSTLWKVQDFSLELSSIYQLNSYSFQAGLSRLLFTYKDDRLLVCRMAPASDRLLHKTLTDLLCSLHEQLSPEHVEISGENDVQCATNPSLAGQVLLRLKRQKAFCRGVLHHDRINNRIQALVIESNKPILPEAMETLFSHYEIIPNQKT